jgi:hypothetical protein
MKDVPSLAEVRSVLAQEFLKLPTPPGLENFNIDTPEMNRKVLEKIAAEKFPDPSPLAPRNAVPINPFSVGIFPQVNPIPSPMFLKYPKIVSAQPSGILKPSVLAPFAHQNMPIPAPHHSAMSAGAFSNPPKPNALQALQSLQNQLQLSLNHLQPKQNTAIFPSSAQNISSPAAGQSKSSASTTASRPRRLARK